VESVTLEPHRITRLVTANAKCLNRTILGMLRTLRKNEKQDWKSHINKVVHAYNCTENETTGFAPFFLLFGRSPRLPIDVIFGLDNQSDKKRHTHMDRADTLSLYIGSATSFEIGFESQREV
jgi:hypothetical protein